MQKGGRSCAERRKKPREQGNGRRRRRRRRTRQRKATRQRKKRQGKHDEKGATARARADPLKILLCLVVPLAVVLGELSKSSSSGGSKRNLST